MRLSFLIFKNAMLIFISMAFLQSDLTYESVS